MEVNVSEEVTLNCSASSSPDAVYSWSIPDSSSSYPKFSNDSVITFTVDITSSRDYICTAENDYGTDTKLVAINVICKFKSTHIYIFLSFKCTSELDTKRIYNDGAMSPYGIHCTYSECMHGVY